MSDVVVVGAGLAGMATAARLAKLGHRVLVCERNAEAGGAMRAVERDGFQWDAGPASMVLPAVLRDLFRKSGRPLEHYVELAARDPIRRYRFEDGSALDLPGGSRSAQLTAMTAVLGDAAAVAWTAYVDRLGPVWEALRRQVLDPEYGGRRLGERDVARQLDSRASVARLVRRELHDERLRAIATHPFVLAGSSPADVPAFEAVQAYLERAFGVWSAPGGLAAVTGALVTRLAERKVDLRVDTEVVAIRSDGRRVTGVVTAAGETIPADVVVSAIDTRALLCLLGAAAPPRLRSVVAGSTPAEPCAVTHLGLHDDGLPALPGEVVFTGDPLLVLHTTGRAPEGAHAWTVWRRGKGREDVLLTLARRGIDVRHLVVIRVDRSPPDVLAEGGGSPWGIRWNGWRAQVRRAGLIEPLDGLQIVGASAFPGASVPYVGWGAAHVAARLGKA